MLILKRSMEDLGATFTASVEFGDLTSSAMIPNAKISESLRNSFYIHQ